MSESRRRPMPDSLEEHASDSGIARPSVSEAWSLRAHGLGARATPRWAAVAAATALLAFLVAAWLLLSDAIMLPGADIVRLVSGVFLAPLALALSAVVLLHRAGQLSAPAALFTATWAVPAYGFAALTAASWSAGFEEADAGLGLSWFGSATLLFLLLAWSAGTISLMAPFAAVLKKTRPASIRWVLGGALAAISAVVLGVLMLMGQMIGILGAAALLVLALRGGDASLQAAPRGSAHKRVRWSTPGLRVSLTRRKYLAVASAALLSLIVGLVFIVVALTGSSWVPGVTDSTHAMNLGLAAGALAAIPAVLAAGMILTPLYGLAMRGAVLACCASLMVEAAAQNSGAGHPLQWPLTLAAALLLGIAISLPWGRLVPGSSPLRIGVMAVLGLAGSVVGLLIVTMAAFIAPLGAAGLLAWAATRLKRIKAVEAPRAATIH